LHDFCDFDKGGDIDIRRSTNYHVFFLGEVTISWASKKQATLIHSSIGVEYMACTQATKEALWLRRFLREVGYK
jgi:hypothetical protein